MVAGFFERMNAKNELKIQQMFLEQADVLDLPMEFGLLDLQCHIGTETHHGFYMSNGAMAYGFFMCQGRWWAQWMSVTQLEKLQDPNCSQTDRAMTSLVFGLPENIGRQVGGVQAFALMASAFDA